MPLTRRALGRATLARQHLLARTDRPVEQVLEDVAGLQAQTPQTWYVGLFSRIRDFAPAAASDALADRRIVRTALMRSTLHLVTVADAARLRPAVQPVLDRDLTGNQLHGRAARALDLDAVAAAAAQTLDGTALTPAELGAALAPHWPDTPPATLAYAARNLLPLVQVPPRGLWGRSGRTAHTTLASWTGAPEPAPPLSRPGWCAATSPRSARPRRRRAGLVRPDPPRRGRRRAGARAGHPARR